MKPLHKQRGVAAVEAAIALPVLILMLFVVIEVGNAVFVYISVIEASRDGVRMVIQQDSAVGLDERLADLVEPALKADKMSSEVTYRRDSFNNPNVTVEVEYAYQPILAGSQIVESIFGTGFRIGHATTMAVP